MRKSDPLFFYATKPASGIIGVTRVQKTMKGDTPFWPNEIRQGKVHYPYRIRFKDVLKLKENDWKTKRISIRHLNVVYYRGANAARDKENLGKLVDVVEKTLGKVFSRGMCV